MRLYSSTGLKAVILALCLCKRASLFGFGKFDPSLGNHHYFENTTKEEFPDHDYEAEAIFYRKMQDRSASIARVFDETNQNLDLKYTVFHRFRNRFWDPNKFILG